MDHLPLPTRRKLGASGIDISPLRIDPLDA